MYFLDKALELSNLLNEKQSLALIQYELGKIYFRNNNYSKAQEYYSYSYDNYVELEDAHYQAILANSLGLVYFEWGDYEKSLDYYKTGLKIFERF